MSKTERSGLKPEHHGELNTTRFEWERRNINHDERLLELRKEYADDHMALQQIDVYEGGNDYAKRIDQYVDAIKSRDTNKQSVLERWFRIYYPDI